MSDVSFSFGMQDQVTPVLTRQKAAAKDLQKTLKDAGQAASKAGGPVGGLVGRLLGGAGGPFAGIALAATAATFALTALNAASERNIKLAQDQVGANQKLAQVYKSGAEARAAVAAGGLSQADATRRLIARGGSIDDAKGIVGKGVGIGLNDAIQGQAGLQLISDTKRRAATQDAALKLAATGEVTYAEAVKRLADRRGSIDLVRELVDLKGQLPTAANRSAAQSQLALTGGNDLAGRYGAGAALRNVNAATSAGDLVGLTQSGDLTSGATARAITDQVADILDPTAKALTVLKDEVARGAELLNAAAAAQGKIAEALADVGMLMGGEGSRRTQASAYRSSNRKITTE